METTCTSSRTLAGMLYLSKENFEKLRSGEEEASLEVGLKAWWCVHVDLVKLAYGKAGCRSIDFTLKMTIR